MATYYYQAGVSENVNRLGKRSHTIYRFSGIFWVKTLMRQKMSVFEQARINLLGKILTVALAVVVSFLVSFSGSAQAQSTAFKQAVALAAGKDEAVIAFYKERNYKPIWTSSGDRQRRKAFLEAISKAGDHGLPVERYNAVQLKKAFGSIRSAKARGALEAETTLRFLQYAQDIQSGILEPKRIDPDMAISPPRRDRLETLKAFLASNPRSFLRALPPKHPDYVRLLKEKARLEKVVGNGGWGPKVSTKALKPGRSNPKVVELRKRLTAMGYRKVGISPEYNEALAEAVKVFQIDHGLNADGVAGPGTMAAINTSAQYRLQQVIVGLERQRWLNKPRGKRHIFVNQADFRAHVMDNGKPTLTTRVVVGKPYTKFRTPEFSDTMTHMIINPTWHVPKSIARNEYLPMLQEDPSSLGRQGIRMTDIYGQEVDPETVDYSEYDQENFPFDLKQPPGRGNALGKVKFMFPNKFNVYLHDTPSKSLFARDGRAFSHGCVRVQKPFDLAYTLLAPQSANPKALFHNYLDAISEAQVDLVKSIPVHLVYHTVWVTASGRPNYRKDTYGRDKKVFSALTKAGVVLRAVRG